jgi:O-antigen ligase
MSNRSTHGPPRHRATLSRINFLLPLTFPLAALPFASVHNTALLTIGVALSALAFIGFASPSIIKRLHPKTALLFLAASIPLWLAVLQLWPLETELRAALQPGYDALTTQSMALSESTTRPLSLHPRQTLVELCFGIGILALAALSAITLNSHHRARKAAEVLVMSAAAIAALGIAQNMTGGNHVLWLFYSDEWKQPFATFINNNHGAVTISACAPLGLYLAFRSRDEQQLLFWSTLTGVIALGSLTSGSRSGAIILAASCLLYALAQSSRSVMRIGLFLLIPAAIGVAYFGFESSFQEITLLVDPDFYPEQSLDTGRRELYRASLPLIWSAPFIGAGAGAFSEAFKSRHLVEITSTVQQAHSDPIEAAIEYGLPAATLWLLLALYVFGKLAYGCRKKIESSSQNTTAAFFAAAFGIALHSLWDFPFRIGATAILFALALGAAWGTLLHKPKTPAPRLAVAAQAVMGMLALVALGLGGFAFAKTFDTSSHFGAVDHTLAQAKAARESGEQADAQLLYRAALKQKPFEHRALLALAMGEAEQDRPEVALQILEGASRIYADNHYIWLNMARIERSAGRSLQAAQHYRTLLALRSPSRELGDAWTAEALSNHPSPHTVANIILPVRPDRWCQAARILTRDHSKEAGEAMYQLASTVDPDCDYGYAAQLLQWRRPLEAMELISTLPQNCSTLRIRGFSQMALKQYTDAAATLQEANMNCTLDVYGRYQLAIAKLESGDENGLRILRQLVVDHDEVYLRRALTFRLESSGDVHEATKQLRVMLERNQIKATEIDPKHYPRLHHEASIYGDF